MTPGLLSKKLGVVDQKQPHLFKITQAIFCPFSEWRRELSVFERGNEWNWILKTWVCTEKKKMNEGHSATYDITEDKVQTQTDYRLFEGSLEIIKSYN